jgi:competence protein ComEC
MTQDNTSRRLWVLRTGTSAIVLRAGRPAPLAWDGRAWVPWVSRNLVREIEQRRAFPWIPVCFGLGILLCFQAEGRPSLWAPLLGAVLSGAVAARLRSRPIALAVMVGLSALFAGFAAAVIRARDVEAPIVPRVMITALTGFVETIEDRPHGYRIVLRVTGMGELAEESRPERIRVSVRHAGGLAPGQHIAATARLLPPPQPAWPGGYDFARDAYFRGIGAVGSLVGPVRPAPAREGPGWGLAMTAAVDGARNALTGRIAEAVGGPAGGVAAALITGKRGRIEEKTNDILRAAGIYHIVSISGLHMVLAAGSFFWLTRALLALTPAALLWPVKKVAAVIAMAGAGAYCVFSGSEVATERSLITTLVMFGAILVDRPALSIRNCAIAALVVLAREPETLLGPSFQMSFGAVLALIALASGLQRQDGDGLPASWPEKAVRRLLRSLVGLVSMTLVASLATAPFAAYHFQTLTPFGLIGNGLALPLVSLVVMPAGLLGVLAYPFGLDRPVWQVMGAAVSTVLDLSAWVSSFEGSTVVVPAFGAGALAALSMALLLGTLPASSLRWLALLPAGAGLAMAAAPDRFDVTVDREGAGAAIRGRGGRLVIVGRPSGFVVEQWLRADGDPRGADDPSLREGVRCDRGGCVAELADGRSVALTQTIAAFEQDCRRAAIVLSPRHAPPGCEAALVVDRNVLDRHGAAAVYVSDGTMRLRPTRRNGENRPWMSPSRREEQTPPPRPVRRRSTEPRRTGAAQDEALSTGGPD